MGEAVELPEPRRNSGVSVESALARRRSTRDFSAEPVPLASLSQLLWAAQGITAPDGLRTAPSAGALYPLEIYLVIGVAKGLRSGVYHYDPRRHRLLPHVNGDVRSALAKAALEQEWVAEAPALLILAAVHRRTARKYGRRAPRYVYMEVGHAAQNIYLQAVALDLGTVMVGAFRNRELERVLRLPADVEAVGVMPVGKPR
ncbi:MAG: SagB/ThcOx family dehydrogenase [Deltaproteobacteria bacterium]|nr:SagB/ThcOx family dehydrogenase [Deltaproteobacteria bacterium]MBW2363143.1 SagB/ThcOx family dehydrogenase [Deltaproteobacteria bacterium]